MMIIELIRKDKSIVQVNINYVTLLISILIFHKIMMIIELIRKDKSIVLRFVLHGLYACLFF
jgi:hypothetical protein